MAEVYHQVGCDGRDGLPCTHECESHRYGHVDLTARVNNAVLHLWRTALTDLLTGRVFRHYADEGLQVALDAERYGAPVAVVDQELARAAHWEWMAVRAECGQILWGGRCNRCGYQSEREESE